MTADDDVTLADGEAAAAQIYPGRRQSDLVELDPEGIGVPFAAFEELVIRSREHARLLVGHMFEADRRDIQQAGRVLALD